MKSYSINFKPTSDQIEEIKTWLIEEESNLGKGFYCNWSSIAHSFNDGKIAVLIEKQCAIGFITWFEWEKFARIQIAEIKPDYRRKGFGKYMTERLFEKLEKKGIAVIDLHCQPATSQKIWKRMGFKRFPDVKDFIKENNEKEPYLYKILVPHLKPTKSSALKESIQLWQIEPHLARQESYALKWHPRFEKGSRRLVYPIISPAKREWQIQWSKNDGTFKSDKIKYLLRIDIDFGNFLIINELPQ